MSLHFHNLLWKPNAYTTSIVYEEEASHEPVHTPLMHCMVIDLKKGLFGESLATRLAS